MYVKYIAEAELVPTIYVLSKNEKNIKNFLMIFFFIFTAEKISVYCMDKFSKCYFRLHYCDHLI